MDGIDQASFDPPPEVLFSMNALRRAWRFVRRSGPSAGTDGLTQAQFEEHLDVELNRLRQHMLNGTYQPQPVRRFYVKKASDQQRPISIWAMRDRVAQRVIHDYLTPLLESILLDCSYGFRPERSVEQAVQAVIRARDEGLLWVLDADISDCFGSIPPLLLLAQVRRVIPSAFVLKLLDLWLHTPVAGGKPGETAGVSQGGVISPQLANLYLHRFDEMVLAALPQARLVRFADDFVILCRSDQEAAWSLEVARRSLENLRLTLNMRKTRLVHFEEGFTFLGVSFKGRWHQAAVPQPNREET
jgi:group II intron reverse transcriptase/maturase